MTKILSFNKQELKINTSEFIFFPTILSPGNTYALNRQLVAEVGAGGTEGAVQHGFKCTNTSRIADNCNLFKIRFKSIIKHPV